MKVHSMNNLLFPLKRIMSHRYHMNDCLFFRIVDLHDEEYNQIESYILFFYIFDENHEVPIKVLMFGRFVKRESFDGGHEVPVKVLRF